MRSLVAPVLYLVALGLALGQVVGAARLGLPSGVPYERYVAPALVATTAATTASLEATFPVLMAINPGGIYRSMLASPLRVVDLLVAHLAWNCLRVLLAVGGYLLVVTPFGLVPVSRAPGILLGAVLVGLAFATLLEAYAATQRSNAPLEVVARIALVPLFLFSGVFFPLEILPPWMQRVVSVMPMWQGVALCRGLALGGTGALEIIGHTAYLLATAVTGGVLAYFAYRRRLNV